MDWLKKKKKVKQSLLEVRERGAELLEDVIECCNGKSNPIKFFSADQIIKATNNFSKSNRVPGLYYFESNWYSGKINNHPMICFRDDFPGYKESYYRRDIVISSMVSGHKNFLKLLGCCLELEKPVIVYSFVKISSLDLEMVVSWKRRIKIAEDIAIALAYLHTAFPRPFVYRIMSLASILLDEHGVARSCDFSRCISIPQGETFVKVDRIVGTYDFVDDTSMSTGRVSQKTDVFAIGVLMQKLLSGEERFRELCEEHQDDVESLSGLVPIWRSKSMEKLRMDEIADPKMLEETDEVGEEELCQMEAFLLLSLKCIGLRGEVPNMVEVAKELKKIQRPLKNFSSSPSHETKIVSAQELKKTRL